MAIKKIKLAVVVSHPIPYQVPFFRILAERADVDLSVYFMSDIGISDKHMDPEFGKIIKFDLPLLSGYPFAFVKNYSPRPKNSFLGLINPEIIIKLFKSKPDYLFVHGWNSFSNCIAMFAAVLVGTKILMHGDTYFSGEAYKPRWKKLLKRVILWPLFKLSHKILYMGVESKKFFEYYGARSSQLIFMPFSADNKHFIGARKSIDRDFERSKMGLRDSIVILFSGKLIPRKRPMDVLRAYEKLSQSVSADIRSRLAIVFMGDGELRGELEAYTAAHNIQRVHFVGFQNLTKLPVYYAIADIFVISSFNECWGLVVNEAMCFGLPIISSNLVGAVPDLVREGENGYIYPCGDVEKLKECLEKIIISKKLRERFGRKSFEIISKYTSDEDVRSVISALK